MNGKDFLLLAIGLLLTSVPSSLSQTAQKKNLLQIIHQWIFANFDYNTPQDRINAEQLGHLIPGNVAILDSDYFIDPKTHKRRIFVTSPQFLSGIPATLAEVRDQKRDAPIMTPYPSWDAQNILSCTGPVSVYRIFIDKCGLLWVLDSGMVETFLVPRRACRPKVLIYDLNRNDELVARYEFPDGVVSELSILITIVTESYQKDCKDSIAYIADVQARGLIIFNFPNRTSWRVENSYFYPFPDHGVVRIKNTTFDLMDGLFGLVLSPETDEQRKLYFHSAASIRESWVLTSILKNSTAVTDIEILRREFHHSEDIRDGQSTIEVMTDDGILIYPVLSKNALACWNSAQPLEKEFQYTIYEDNENLQFVSGMKLKNKTLMITSSKLQNYILLQANGTDIKYRVMFINNIDLLLDGTPCRKIQKRPTNQVPKGGVSTPHYQPTTRKPVTTQRPTHKPSSHEKSPDDEIDNKQGILFGHQPQKPSPHDHARPVQPPFWHSPTDHELSHKPSSHEQNSHKIPTSGEEYSHNYQFFEQSSNKHFPPTYHSNQPLNPENTLHKFGKKPLDESLGKTSPHEEQLSTATSTEKSHRPTESSHSGTQIKHSSLHKLSSREYY